MKPSYSKVIKLNHVHDQNLDFLSKRGFREVIAANFHSLAQPTDGQWDPSQDNSKKSFIIIYIICDAFSLCCILIPFMQYVLTTCKEDSKQNSMKQKNYYSLSETKQ